MPPSPNLRSQSDVSKSLSTRVRSIIGLNYFLYRKSQFQIEIFMMKRWRHAFVQSSERVGSEFEEDWPEDLITVASTADFGANDKTKFLKDLNSVFDHLAKGGSLEKGEFT